MASTEINCPGFYIRGAPCCLSMCFLILHAYFFTILAIVSVLYRPIAANLYDCLTSKYTYNCNTLRPTCLFSLQTQGAIATLRDISSA